MTGGGSAVRRSLGSIPVESICQTYFEKSSYKWSTGVGR